MAGAHPPDHDPGRVGAGAQGAGQGPAVALGRDGVDAAVGRPVGQDAAHLVGAAALKPGRAARGRGEQPLHRSRAEPAALDFQRHPARQGLGGAVARVEGQEAGVGRGRGQGGGGQDGRGHGAGGRCGQDQRQARTRHGGPFSDCAPRRGPHPRAKSVPRRFCVRSPPPRLPRRAIGKTRDNRP
ncbi:hypothetical protein D3C77_187080 [compost metagenome]